MSKKQFQLKDFLGRDVKIGDFVACASTGQSKSLEIGLVVGGTDASLRVLTVADQLGFMNRSHGWCALLENFTIDLLQPDCEFVKVLGKFKHLTKADEDYLQSVVEKTIHAQWDALANQNQWYAALSTEKKDGIIRTWMKDTEKIYRVIMNYHVEQVESRAKNVNTTNWKL